MSVHADIEQEMSVHADILAELTERHPRWITRLETSDFYPISLIPIHALRIGDVIDIRDFGIEAANDNAFMVIEELEGDDRGLYSITGQMPDGTILDVVRIDGVAIQRRKVVRFGRRHRI